MRRLDQAVDAPEANLLAPGIRLPRYVNIPIVVMNLDAYRFPVTEQISTRLAKLIEECATSPMKCQLRLRSLAREKICVLAPKMGLGDKGSRET